MLRNDYSFLLSPKISSSHIESNFFGSNHFSLSLFFNPLCAFKQIYDWLHYPQYIKTTFFSLPLAIWQIPVQWDVSRSIPWFLESVLKGSLLPVGWDVSVTRTRRLRILKQQSKRILDFGTTVPDLNCPLGSSFTRERNKLMS